MSFDVKRPTWRIGFPVLREAASGSDVWKLREEGDAQRDKRCWVKAAAAYKAYLERQPADSAIWVQLGHALKEDGFLEEGFTCYERALELAPSDEDARRHFSSLRSRLFESRDEAHRSSRPPTLEPRTDWQSRTRGQSAEMRDIELLTRRLEAY